MTTPTRLSGAKLLCALTLSTLSIVGYAAPALAAPQSDLVVTYAPNGKSVTRQMPVEIADLRLSSPQGRAMLEERIIHAAKTVCDYQPLLPREEKKDYERCFSDAKSAALNNAMLVQTASR